MNSVMAATLLLASTAGGQEPIFTSGNVKGICGKAIYNKIRVPLEVIGHKKFFATMLNAAHNQPQTVRAGYALTQEDIKELLHSGQYAFSDSLKDKLAVLIDQAHKQIHRKLKREKRLDEIIRITKSYEHGYDFTQWYTSAMIPLSVLNKIPDYIENFNLERAE